MKVFKASVSLYLNHISAALASVFLAVAFYDIAQNRPFIFSLVTTLIYVGALYSAAWRIGRRDGRNIPGFETDIMMPVRLSVFTSIIPLVLLVLRLVLPDILPLEVGFVNGKQDFIVGGCRVIGTPDMIYRIWFFHFASFVSCGNIFAYIAELFVLPIIIFIGYYVGVSKFSISDWLYSKVVFSGRKDNEIEK